MAATDVDGLSLGEGPTCETPGCGKVGKLQCPTCIKLNIRQCHFCSQDCFKKYWNDHKVLHKIAKAVDNGGANGEPAYEPWPGYHFTGSLRPYPYGPRRTVPPEIMRPDYADHPEGISYSEKNAKQSGQIKILDDEEVAGVKLACKLAREVLDEAAQAVAVGVTADELDRIVHEASVERECYPSPLNYYTFPKSCCTSVNEVICHGIPDLRPLVNGDLCNIDVTVYHRGFHGDLNETFFVGEVEERYKNLVRVTHECLMEAIKIVKPGVKFREIGDVIQKHAQAHKYSVVRTYCGHGIHRAVLVLVPWYEYALENAFYYITGIENKAVGVMHANQSFTIEPMINEGSSRDVTWPDHWTAVTEDGKRSAQFEHQLLVTDTGCEIMTKRPKNNGQPWFMDNL